MKKIFLILLTVLIAGCVADRKSEPAIEAEKVLNCPEIVEAAAKNLEQIKIDQLLVQAWKQNVLSKKMQPCNACQKLNVAAYILKDEQGIYKPAMLEYIQNMGKNDPNVAKMIDKPYISASTIDDKQMEKQVLAEQYMRAIEDLQTFLSTEIKIPVLDAKNFVLDNYFIPLMQNEKKIQDVNQP